jgi:hypothetical protein
MLGEDGRARVRAFVARGGGYVGICAGAYMALQGRAEFYKLALVAGRHATGDAWIRGIAPLPVRPEGGGAPFPLHYANGPLIAPQPVEGLAPLHTLATFEGEVALPAQGTHPGEMRGAPAIVATSHGRGRVLLFSPNPTLDPARPELLVAALRWVAAGGAVPESMSFGTVFGAR